MLLLALLLAPSALLADPHLVVDLERALVPPIIDADLSDWRDAHWLALSPDAPHVLRGPGSFLRDDGPTEAQGTAGTAADLSGSFALRWDAENLYLAARIRDNAPDADGGAPWQWYLRDGAALFLDLALDGDGPAWIAGDHAFALTAAEEVPAWWRHGDAGGHRELPAPPELRRAVRPAPDGYLLEAALPAALLSRTCSTWAHQEGREAGFSLVFTDPDGGAQPFGGQLLFAGRGDDDATWARLRLAERAAPPRREVSPEEIAFEERVRADHQILMPFHRVGTDSLGLQVRLASGYFQTYLQKRPSRLATRALSLAFTLWGNAGAADSLGRALAQIPGEADDCDLITSGFRQGFYLADRLDEGMALLEEKLPGVGPLRSRSALLYALADYWHSRGEKERARQAYAQIVAWRASLWRVNEAVRQLRRMEEGEDGEI